MIQIYVINLYLAAIIPSILIVIFFFFRDKFREPPKVVFYTFLLGFLFILPLSYMNVILDEFSYNLNASAFAKEIFSNFIRAGFHEELYKYLILIFYCSRHTKFNEPMDAIVYGLAVSLGFSARENIDYILNYDYYKTTWEYMATIRIIPTIMHGVNSIIMGLFLSKALFVNQSTQRRLFLALLIPVLFHGTYNMVISESFLLGCALLLGGFIYTMFLYKKVRKFQYDKNTETEIKYNAKPIIVFKSVIFSFILVSIITFIAINF